MRVDSIFCLVMFLLIAPASQAAAIHDAAKKGDVAALTAALDSGVDINASDGIATPPAPTRQLSSRGRRRCMRWRATAVSTAWWPSLKRARTSMH